MKLTVIGCNGSFAGPAGAASSYLIEQEDEAGRPWRVVVDLGSGAFGPLQDHVDPVDVDALVITHLHPDHFLDITGLEVYRAYHERQDVPCLPVYGPADLAPRLRSIMGRQDDVPDGLSHVPFTFHDLVDGGRFGIGPLTFEAGRVRHPVETYGLRISGAGAVISYSADTDSCDRLVDLAAQADLFLCEAGYIEGRDDRFPGIHLTGRRAAQAAVAADVRRLVLTHIASWTDPAIPLAEATEVFGGDIEIARPGEVFELTGA
jgi:ribonuclease BN (tRNA processing enzyme)